MDPIQYTVVGIGGVGTGHILGRGGGSRMETKGGEDGVVWEGSGGNADSPSIKRRGGRANQSGKLVSLNKSALN